jgi:hypothetical protein
MAKKYKTQSHTNTHTHTKTYPVNDIRSWGFVVFLTTALVLLIIIVTQIGTATTDMRSKANSACPQVTIPDPALCKTGWKYFTKSDGCPSFMCQ